MKKEKITPQKMKIRFLILFMACLAGLILYSCSKEKENSDLNLASSGIKKIIKTDLKDNEITNYQFGYQSGNLVQLTVIYSDKSRDSMLFIYDDNKKLIQIKWNSENLIINYSYDKNGDIDSARNIQSSWTQYWHYNNQHELVSVSNPGFPEDTIIMNWNSEGDVIFADFSNTNYTVTYDNKVNPFIGFPEQPAVLTGIINVGAYFMSPPTKNNVTEAIAVSGQNTSRMSLKYEYNSNSLPTKMYEGIRDESGLDSVICEFTY
jgi:hypothetical protein